MAPTTAIRMTRVVAAVAERNILQYLTLLSAPVAIAAGALFLDVNASDSEPAERIEY